ncbi:hypothetical protein QTP70_017367 [Hemibagrus guttatus]|uniref:Uncharacterized protein n=1 Tax=Hemibagrus guttatus TaxID=175788 RepID=A0AAE0RFX6_9TELE|nr:hypothetical protein QTP70_017367 [Hemibagrus guttatus]
MLMQGQTAEIPLIRAEDGVKNAMTKIHNVSHIPGVNGKLVEEYNKDNATFEDQEGFQNQENIHHFGKCNETLLRILGEDYCLKYFDSLMSELREEEWCDWEMVLSNYNELTHCLEDLCATFVHCYYPNPVVQDMFVKVHKKYFSLCGTKEEVLPDAPARVVLVLTLLPVSVIPILVYMVIWKSSVID